MTPRLLETGNLVRRLLVEESRLTPRPVPKGRLGFQLCERLRQPLCAYAGTVGFRSLLRRALFLTKPGNPWLAELAVAEDGTFAFPPALEADLDSDTALEAGTALAERLIGLLDTFIGEALTLRLLDETWPKAAITKPKS